VDDPAVSEVVLRVNSPGGTVLGAFETADLVYRLNRIKPITAWVVNGMAASAGYLIASGAGRIIATRGSRTGSIGVVQAVVDNSAALDKAGIKVEVFSVGKYKAMGAPGTPLTDDQRELISSNLAEIAGEFHAAVLAKGRAIDLHQEEFSELGTFRGTMASLGCGIILAALVLVVMAALVGGLAHEFGWGFGGWLAGTWPIVALAALGGFLLLQLLPLLVAGGREHE
jgi:signal peptide peptidase SppA